MIESVERLKRFVAASEKRNHQNIGYILDDVGLDISDLKEALSLIPPYAPGQEIEVRDNVKTNDWEKRIFLFVDGSRIACKHSEEAGRYIYWEHHRPIPSTVTVDLPVELYNWCKKSSDDALNDGYCTQAEKLRQAIVASARKE